MGGATPRHSAKGELGQHCRRNFTALHKWKSASGKYKRGQGREQEQVHVRTFEGGNSLVCASQI
eukprot:scaffold106160_cov14-Tisochrysis_lutea.AAC.1